MSMEIEKNGFVSYYTDNNKKISSVRVTTVELKTSKSNVTKTTQIKTNFKNINDYAGYLQERYGFMNTGKTYMNGIPTTVTVSTAFLAKCNKDPEKAKFLEENLAVIPDCSKKTLTDCLGTVTNQTWSIDANGNITATISGTNDPDGKIARENAERKAKKQQKIKTRRKEKTSEQKYIEEKRLKEEICIKASGNNVWYTFENLKAKSFFTNFLNITI